MFACKQKLPHSPLPGGGNHRQYMEHDIPVAPIASPGYAKAPHEDRSISTRQSFGSF